MTKYKEHARLLYQRLQGSADHVFLLQGGKSSKERAQVRDALLAVSETDTLIVVAIGKYIGEGFNLPRLDTLLLAMPISWQGNVEQYAGRLNRDYDGKQDVIIFDYIDAHVPTLERMYHKRLRACALIARSASRSAQTCKLRRRRRLALFSTRRPTRRSTSAICKPRSGKF